MYSFNMLTHSFMQMSAIEMTPVKQQTKKQMISLGGVWWDGRGATGRTTRLKAAGRGFPVTNGNMYSRWPRPLYIQSGTSLWFHLSIVINSV